MKGNKGFYLVAMVAVAAVSAFVVPARADWPNANPTKWVQPPDLDYGMDILAISPKILADDFLCTFTGPITDIHIWGSWLNNQVGVITNFHLSIHADIPATTSYSRPGTLLWSYDFGPGEFVERLWTNANEEAFYDPNIGHIIGTDTQVWQYNFFVPPGLAFTQQVNNIYWLDVQVFTGTTNTLFGWKTSSQHWNDDAVFDDTPQDPADWRELRYPTGHPQQGQSIDLAFALTTIPEPSTLLLVTLGAGAMACFGRRARGRPRK